MVSTDLHVLLSLPFFQSISSCYYYLVVHYYYHLILCSENRTILIHKHPLPSLLLVDLPVTPRLPTSWLLLLPFASLSKCTIVKLSRRQCSPISAKGKSLSKISIPWKPSCSMPFPTTCALLHVIHLLVRSTHVCHLP